MRGLSVPARDAPSVAYGFGRWAIFAMVGLSYFSAGWSKVREGGPMWWDAANMRSKIFIDALEPKLGIPLGMWVCDQPDWLLAGLGIFTLVVEGAMIFVLVSPRSRLILAPAVVPHLRLPRHPHRHVRVRAADDDDLRHSRALATCTSSAVVPRAV